jgi:aminoglycoside phosphotransferase (APT) family kinase protein
VDRGGRRRPGVIDWSEAAQGDALYDLATLTLGHPEHLGDVIAGYGTDIDRELIRAWWSLRSLTSVRWLVEHGYGPPEDYPEVAVLRGQQPGTADPDRPIAGTAASARLTD